MHMKQNGTVRKEQKMKGSRCQPCTPLCSAPEDLPAPAPAAEGGDSETRLSPLSPHSRNIIILVYFLGVIVVINPFKECAPR